MSFKCIILIYLVVLLTFCNSIAIYLLLIEPFVLSQHSSLTKQSILWGIFFVTNFVDSLFVFLLASGSTGLALHLPRQWKCILKLLPNQIESRIYQYAAVVLLTCLRFSTLKAGYY